MKLMMTLKEVKTASSLSIATIYRRIAAGKFPRPVPVSERGVRWRVTDIEAWGRDPAAYSTTTRPAKSTETRHP